MTQNEPDSYRIAISVQGLKISYKNIVKILTALLQKRWMACNRCTAGRPRDPHRPS